MKIELYAAFGSPDGIDPETIWEYGVGGAELAMIEWSDEMSRRGHEVLVYNDPARPGFYNNVKYTARSEFWTRRSHEVVIMFRGPLGSSRQNIFYERINATRVVFWSCDQFTYGDYAASVFPFVDCVVCISARHSNFFREYYTSVADEYWNAVVKVIGLGVRASDYSMDVPRDPNQLIYCSVPDRGLQVLRDAWPLILERWPDAKLTITSDYRLWGGTDPKNEAHRASWLSVPQVTFLGKIPRTQLVRAQLASAIMAYPCTYDELFCISLAECQLAGAIPVTAASGAIETTQVSGIMLPPFDNSPRWLRNYAEAICKMQPRFGDVERIRTQMIKSASATFDWSLICDRWESDVLLACG